MKEKIALRIAEVEAWGDLAVCLDNMEDAQRRDLEEYTALLNEEYPDGGEDMKGNWRYANIKQCKAKIAAYESIRATILRACLKSRDASSGEGFF